MHKTISTIAPAPGEGRTMRSALVIGVALAVMTIATGARAQSTGVAACDEYLTKFDTCITSKIPAAQQATFKGQLDQTRKTWADLAKNPACKQSTEAMKPALAAYGCAF